MVPKNNMFYSVVKEAKRKEDKRNRERSVCEGGVMGEIDRD